MHGQVRDVARGMTQHLNLVVGVVMWAADFKSWDALQGYDGVSGVVHSCGGLSGFGAAGECTLNVGHCAVGHFSRANAWSHTGCLVQGTACTVTFLPAVAGAGFAAAGRYMALGRGGLLACGWPLAGSCLHLCTGCVGACATLGCMVFYT
jgi:hypothetical protein